MHACILTIRLDALYLSLFFFLSVVAPCIAVEVQDRLEWLGGLDAVAHIFMVCRS